MYLYLLMIQYYHKSGYNNNNDDVIDGVINNYPDMKKVYIRCGVSRHNGGSIEGPFTALGMIVLWWSEGAINSNVVIFPWCRETLVSRKAICLITVVFQYGMEQELHIDKFCTLSHLFKCNILINYSIAHLPYLEWTWILIYNRSCYDLNHCKFRP